MVRNTKRNYPKSFGAGVGGGGGGLVVVRQTFVEIPVGYICQNQTFRCVNCWR